MHIIEIHYPGHRLKFGDDNTCREVSELLRNIVELVKEAAVSLFLFEQRPYCLDHKDLEELDKEIRAQVNSDLKARAEIDFYQNIDEYDLIIKKAIVARKAEMGILPRSYSHKIPFIHAHSFVYAIDSIGKFINELTTYKDVPGKVSNYLDEFNEQLPYVRQVRNSALHIEDRSRAYGSSRDKKDKKKLAITQLGLSNLEGNKLCYTIDDGSYQGIEISADVLKKVGEIANGLIASFQWEGRANIDPLY